MARLGPQVTLTPFEWSLRDPKDNAHLRDFDALAAVSKGIDPDGPSLVGALLRWQIADGYAFYVVTDDDPLTLAHVDYLDGYTVDPALIRGIDREYVREALRREARIASLFSR